MALLTRTHKRSHRAFLRATVAVLASIAAVACLCAPVYAQRAQIDEVKAAFVFQFANYVQWPDGTFENDASPIVIGIVDNENMIKALSASVQGKSIGKRSIKVVDVASDQEAQTCHILYIDSSDDSRVDDYLSAVRSRPVLTVSDDDDFTEEGGIIRLFEAQSKLRFEINVDEVERAKLTISSKLLSLAQVVRDKT